MDEKTEELRDIFLSVSDDAEVTERQEDARGSLVEGEDGDERLLDVVARMRENLGFDTTLDDEKLVTVVRGYYRGKSDAAIARDLNEDTTVKTVARARVDLHLLRDRDRDAPVPLDEIQRTLDETDSVAAAADELGVSASTVRRYRRVLAAIDERRRVNDRYRDAFEDVLADRGLAERMTRDAQQTGLEGAIEGQETDTRM